MTIRVFARCLLTVLLGVPGPLTAEDRLMLGVHPYKAPSKLVAAYTPLTEYLSARLNTPVKLRISRDYQAHIDLIGGDILDIAYMGPSSYVTLVDKYGPKPLLARQAIAGRPYFQGAIITLESSPLQSLEQLKGKRFAFGDPASTMSHLVPRFMLWQAGVDVGTLREYRFLNSHDNVALAVLAGDFDAGAVKETVYRKYRHRGLRVLAMTPSLSEHLFVASNRLESAQVERLSDALMDLHKSPDGERIMRAIKPGMTGMVPVRDADYDNLREIMDALEVMGVAR